MAETFINSLKYPFRNTTQLHSAQPLFSGTLNADLNSLVDDGVELIKQKHELHVASKLSDVASLNMSGQHSTKRI